MSEEVNKWEGLIDQMRKADQVQFPLPNNEVGVITKDKKFKPRIKNKLQQELYGALCDSGVVETPEVRPFYASIDIK